MSQRGMSDEAPSEGSPLPVRGDRRRPWMDLLEVFARQDETLLLSGPSGSGKSRLAAWCHGRSPRCRGPFQVVDLLSVPEEMQMAELFGWKKGAFTGAVQDQEGCVARSQGGTLFIDEIDKLSLRAQAGLLQLMETHQYRVLGDAGRQRTADVRFVVATNADLKAAVAARRFREDLFFRIHVLPIRLPGLRERRDELLPWARYMLERRHQECQGEGTASFTPEAEPVLLRASWPGNLRQLDNVVRRCYALALMGSPLPGVCVGRAQVEQALAFEQDEQQEAVAPPLLESLRHAAEAFIEHALSRKEGESGLGLEHAEALTGLVLEAGQRRLGDVREVFRLLGGDAVVRSRNHQREYRRELDKVARLESAVGAAPRSPEKPEPGFKTHTPRIPS
ncbi:NtrC [Corallococcus coralloides DSM 2259]|uniref:NtrC n=1 Tax=Corallococcus coralloides (strain ATCC 25202 / DSM 2259 / NBRC 100086 / M2) TaxID=1144275 RepID=H8N0Y4_CORCM|nr:sigma 54-interacting transcriptional regulator [Corallococcus coralloides]AFE10923.1 NtrC [Corallococcus coralloides DSM 2259]